MNPIIAQWWQDRDGRQFARLSYVLMSTAEFTERREAVKDSLGGRQASNSPHFFMSSLEYLLARS